MLKSVLQTPWVANSFPVGGNLLAPISVSPSLNESNNSTNMWNPTTGNNWSKQRE